MRSLSSQRPPRRAPAGVLAGAFLGLCACSSSVDPGPGPHPSAAHSLQRLPLTPLGRVEFHQPQDRRAAEWSQLGAEGAAASWDLHGASTRSVLYEGQQVLVIQRTKGQKLEIPLEFAFKETPRVTLSLAARNQGFSIQGSLVKAGQELASTKLAIVKDRALQSLEMSFPTVRGDGLECDSLVLHIPAGEQPLALESVLIEDVALGGYLPAEAFGGVALIEVGPDARRGTCISTAAGARTSFEVKNAEQEFVFSYTIPSSVIRAGRAPELRVVLESGSTELATRVLDFVGDERTPPAWREERIELGRWLGREISANFELVSDEGDLRLAVVGEPQLVLRHSNPRTVLLITSDTHRADHLGFVAGAKGPRTEMLDKLAAGGVSFLDVTSSINNTTPSHVALFTGLTPRDTGIVANAKRLSDAAPTLAERFAEQGYATLAAVSAAPVCYQFSGLGQGFDRYSNPAYRSARNSKETLGQLLEWLPDYEGRPLFVWLHLYDAHAPYEPPQKFIDLYYKDVVDPYDPASPVADISLAPSWDTRIADPVYTESLYKGEVTYQDERLGELLAMDRFWNGTIAFTADHGENLRNGGEYRFEHRGLTHSTLAVPLIFRGPDLERGMRRRAPVQQIDVGRTLLDIAGYPEVDFPGENVFSKSEDDDTPRFAIEANGFSASILSGKWMLLFGLRPTRSNTDTTRKWLHNVALYDIEADEACQEDVSGQHPEVAAQLRRLMVRWLDQGQQNRWKEEAIGSAAEVARQLNELGYVTLDDDGSSGAWIEADCACENCARFE